MPTKKKPMQVPEEVWERLKRQAAKEGRTMTDIVTELVMNSESETDQLSEPRVCIFCNRKISSWRRVCDQCYYDPDVIRPQKVGLIYYHYCLAVVPEFKEAHEWREFEKWLTREIAIEFYGLTEDEWECYQQWRQWKEMIRNGTTTTDDPRWKEFCISCYKLGYTGTSAGHQVFDIIFRALLSAPKRTYLRTVEVESKNIGRDGE